MSNSVATSVMVRACSCRGGAENRAQGLERAHSAPGAQSQVRGRRWLLDTVSGACQPQVDATVWNLEWSARTRHHSHARAVARYGQEEKRARFTLVSQIAGARSNRRARSWPPWHVTLAQATVALIFATPHKIGAMRAQLQNDTCLVDNNAVLVSSARPRL